MMSVLVFALIASTAALKYAEKGAVASLMAIRITNYKQCPNTPIICYKKSRSSNPSVQKPASSFGPAPKPAESKTTMPQEDRTQDSPTGSEGTPPADQKTAPLIDQLTDEIEFITR
uniref:Secreted protein n=1 Tax=Panagrellus redivivus TaxID=6233 RepID=A0A7E4ZVH4_PANRE